MNSGGGALFMFGFVGEGEERERPFSCSFKWLCESLQEAVLPATVCPLYNVLTIHSRKPVPALAPGSALSPAPMLHFHQTGRGLSNLLDGKEQVAVSQIIRRNKQLV